MSEDKGNEFIEKQETVQQEKTALKMPSEGNSQKYGCLIPALAGIGALTLFFISIFFILLFSAFFQLSRSPVSVKKTIAVVHIEGEIGTSSGIDAESTIRTLKRIESDKNVKAVVLRINSPGGSAASSQEIANFISKMKKPVVASVGDTAASGAYWIAAACDRIICNPASSLGSIGVIVTIPNLEKLAEKIGIKYVVIHKGKFKDMGNPFRDITPEERKLFESHIMEIYNQFIDFVAHQRKLPRAKVEELATGEVFTGIKSIELGLADATGGFYDAVREAKKIAGLKGEVELVDYDIYPGYLEKFFRYFGMPDGMSEINSLLRKIPVAQ